MDKQTGDPRFKALLDAMWELHCRKRQDYGSDEDCLANLRASEEIGIPAWKGTWMRNRDKFKRMDRFCNKGMLANEGVRDTLLDSAAYSLLTLMLFEETVG